MILLFNVQVHLVVEIASVLICNSNIKPWQVSL